MGADAEADGAAEHVAGLAAEGVGDVADGIRVAVVEVAVSRGAGAGDDQAVCGLGELADLAVG